MAWLMADWVRNKSFPVRVKLPEGFQRSEYLMQHGMVDMVVPRPELRAKLVQLLGLLLQSKSAGVVSLAPAQRRKMRERESVSLLVPPDPTVPDYDPDGAPAE